MAGGALHSISKDPDSYSQGSAQEKSHPGSLEHLITGG